jgi:hypothetical protein
MPPPDDSLSSQEFELGHLELEREWHLKQENILPLETAWNEGRFYGLILNGSQPFTLFQRTGILLLGLEIMGIALMMLGLDWHEAGPSLKSLYHRLPDAPLVEVPVLLLEFAAGVRFCWVSLKRPLHRVYDEE